MTKWQKVKLGNLGEVVTGKTPSTKINAYWGSDIPFVTPKDIQSSKHIFITERYLTKDGISSVKGCILPPKSVCVSCIGNIGYTSMTTEVSVSNQQINSIIVNDENDADFVYYLMKSLWSYFKNYEGQSTTLSILNKSQFSKIEVSIPPLAIQKQIAGVLSALDDKIELNNKINQNLEQQAQTLFKSWFIDFTPFGGTMPKDWKIGNLLGIAEYLNGLAMQKFRPTNAKKGIPVLKIKELRQGFCDNSSELCSPNVKNEYIINDGDVIFSWSGSLLVDFWCGGKCGLNQHLFKVSSKKFDKWFYYAWTKYHLNRFITIAADKATTMGHIKRDELEKAEVIIPKSEDYYQISQIIAPIYDLIIKNRIENTHLSQLRDTLLPKLMSGEIDVSKVDISKEIADNTTNL